MYGDPVLHSSPSILCTEELGHTHSMSLGVMQGRIKILQTDRVSVQDISRKKSALHIHSLDTVPTHFTQYTVHYTLTRDAGCEPAAPLSSVLWL